MRCYSHRSHCDFYEPWQWPLHKLPTHTHTHTCCSDCMRYRVCSCFEGRSAKLVCLCVEAWNRGHGTLNDFTTRHSGLEDQQLEILYSLFNNLLTSWLENSLINCRLLRKFGLSLIFITFAAMNVKRIKINYQTRVQKMLKEELHWIVSLEAKMSRGTLAC